MDNTMVGDRVNLDKLVIGETYIFHVVLRELYIPVKIKSITQDRRTGIVWIEFKILADTAGISIPTIIGRTLTEESEFFVDVKKIGRNVRNAQLTGAITGLPHGPESIIASQLSGLPGNAYQQGDSLKKQAGIQGADPKRNQYSGRKTRRRRSKRTRSKKYKRST